MARANVEHPDLVPWTERLYRSAPVAPVWLGIAIAVGLLLVFLVLTWASGGLAAFLAEDVELWEIRDVRIAFLVASLAGYLPTARRYVALGAERNLEDLRPLLDASSLGQSIQRRFGVLDARAARIAGALAILFVPLSGLALDRDPAIYFQGAYWRLENGFGWLVGACACWSGGHFVYATLAYARRFSDVAGQLERIDLLDLQALAPFSRQGLRSALLWLILLSLFSLNALDFGWFAGTVVISLVAGTAALLLPVRGVHRRLRQTKQAELRRVHAAIRGDLDALSETCIARRSASVGLSDLLAYRAYVESIREWPFDSPTLLRFGLYLAIPLGSWLGGAFVERLLGAALD